MITEADAKFIDEFKHTGDGWARFSADRKHRFRLGRILQPRLLEVTTSAYAAGSGLDRKPWEAIFTGKPGIWVNRVIFLMLNPSTADAFKPDRTVDKCCQFAARWGADVVEAVNLFTLITPYPSELRKALDRGAGSDNDREIVAACTQTGVIKVVAAWGVGGDLADRAGNVTSMLRRAGVTLECLGVTNDKLPKHPLARGKHFIPLDTEPKLYASPTSGVIAPGLP